MIRPARPAAPVACKSDNKATARPTISKRHTENETESTPRPPMKSRASMPLSATMPRILSVKPTNIPNTPVPDLTTHKMSMGIIPSSNLAMAAPAPSSSPEAGIGGLMKYKFTGKVDTRQLSSPRL
jgi:hypothetical protein